ncbi:MAG: hypothetical protein QXP34_00555 [Candidatus Aenigmatarchaeota archaeon]
MFTNNSNYNSWFDRNRNYKTSIATTLMDLEELLNSSGLREYLKSEGIDLEIGIVDIEKNDKRARIYKLKHYDVKEFPVATSPFDIRGPIKRLFGDKEKVHHMLDKPIEMEYLHDMNSKGGYDFVYRPKNNRGIEYRARIIVEEITADEKTSNKIRKERKRTYFDSFSYVSKFSEGKIEVYIIPSELHTIVDSYPLYLSLGSVLLPLLNYIAPYTFSVSRVADMGNNRRVDLTFMLLSAISALTLYSASKYAKKPFSEIFKDEIERMKRFYKIQSLIHYSPDEKDRDSYSFIHFISNLIGIKVAERLIASYNTKDTLKYLLDKIREEDQNIEKSNRSFNLFNIIPEDLIYRAVDETYKEIEAEYPEFMRRIEESIKELTKKLEKEGILRNREGI